MEVIFAIVLVAFSSQRRSKRLLDTLKEPRRLPGNYYYYLLYLLCAVYPGIYTYCFANLPTTTATRPGKLNSSPTGPGRCNRSRPRLIYDLKIAEDSNTK